jgi:hypothetical protein
MLHGCNRKLGEAEVTQTRVDGWGVSSKSKKILFKEVKKAVELSESSGSEQL